MDVTYLLVCVRVSPNQVTGIVTWTNQYLRQSNPLGDAFQTLHLNSGQSGLLLTISPT